MTNMPQTASKKVPQPNKRFRKRKRAEPVQNAVAEEPKLPPSTRMSDEAPPKRVRLPNRMLNVTCLCLRFSGSMDKQAEAAGVRFERHHLPTAALDGESQGDAATLKA